MSIRSLATVTLTSLTLLASCGGEPCEADASWSGSGEAVAPGQDNHGYAFFDVDFSGLSAGTTVVLEVTAGDGEASLSSELFAPGVVPADTGAQTEDTCHIYDLMPGHMNTVECIIDEPGIYQLGFEGNWFSELDSINTFDFAITADCE